MAKDFTMILELQLDYRLESNPKNFDYLLALYYWLMEELYKELGDELADVEMDVMRMLSKFEYPYPAIGIYDKPPDSDFKKLLEDTCDRLLRERPISEIINFIGTTDIDWKVEASWLMSRSINYGLRYREQAWDHFYPDEPFYAEGDQDEFRLWLEKTREFAKENLQPPDENSSEYMRKLVAFRRNRDHYRKNLFFSAVGLLSYGILDSIPDIVDTTSHISNFASYSASILNSILPIPAGMNVFDDSDTFQSWVQKNRANLHFDESLGRFKLIDTKGKTAS